MFDEILLLFHSIISIIIAVIITCSFHYMLFPVRALSVSTLPSVAITRPLQSSYCYMPFPLRALSIRLALPA